MRRIHRIVLLATFVAIMPALAGCADFDMDKLDVFGLGEKKKLPGDRKPVFPEGVPGVTQGIPPEYIKGSQPQVQPDAALAAPVEPVAAAPQENVAAAPAEQPKPKPKRASTPKPKVSATAPPAQPAPQQPQQAQTPWPAPAASPPPSGSAAWPAPPPAGTFQR